MNFEGDAFLKLQIAIEPRPWRFFKSLERKQGRLSGRNRFSPKQSGRNISAETSRLAAEADDDVTLLTRPRKNGGLRPRLFGLKVALIRLSLFFNTFLHPNLSFCLVFIHSLHLHSHSHPHLQARTHTQLQTHTHTIAHLLAPLLIHKHTITRSKAFSLSFSHSEKEKVSDDIDWFCDSWELS